MPGGDRNARQGIDVEQPRALPERFEVAKRCCKDLEISIPIVVDEMDGRTQKAYGGLPDMMFVVDEKGNVALKETWANAAKLDRALAEKTGREPGLRKTKGEDGKGEGER